MARTVAGAGAGQQPAGAEASSAAGAPDWEPVEYKMDEFVIKRRLGSGSFATVYLARHVASGLKVVVKKLDRMPSGAASTQDVSGAAWYSLLCVGANTIT